MFTEGETAVSIECFTWTLIVLLTIIAFVLRLFKQSESRDALVVGSNGTLHDLRTIVASDRSDDHPLSCVHYWRL